MPPAPFFNLNVRSSSPMNQVIAFVDPTSPPPYGVPVSAQNPLPVVFVAAPTNAVTPAGMRALVVAFQGGAGQPLQVPVSEQNPLPVSIT